MKKFVAVLMMIVSMIQLSAFAEIEPYGGYAEVSFLEFVDNAEFTDVMTYDGTAYQEMWFANGWHIIAECDEDIHEAQEVKMHVYDDTYWIVESFVIENDDEGEQKVWDIVYGIYQEELP